MTKSIKKSVVLFACAIFLLLLIGSVQAGDLNDTSVLADVDDVDLEAVDVDPTTDEKLNEENDVKTFNDLKDKMVGTTSVVTLNESYKYDPSVDSDPWGHGVDITNDLTLIGENNCYIDGSSTARLLTIGSEYCNVNVVLENITFKNGNTSNNYGGSGIFVYEGSNLTIINCVFENNQLLDLNGAALSAGKHTNITIRNSIFKNNLASLSHPDVKHGMGSAIYVNRGSSLNIYDTKFIGNKARLATVLLVSSEDGSNTEESTAYVVNCTFENNKATEKYSGFYLDEFGTGKFINSTFKNNEAPIGGTLILDSTPYALVENCIFENNKGSSGGAIRLSHDYGDSNVEVIGSKFTGNTAEYGGAIYSDGAILKVINCTFNANHATGTGGAIREMNGGTISVTGSSFTGNIADNLGGAIASETNKATSSNCTYSNNKGGAYPDVYGVCTIKMEAVRSYFGDVQIKVTVTSPWEPLLKQEVRVKLVSGKNAYYTPEGTYTNSSGVAILKAYDKTPVGTYSAEITRRSGIPTINKLTVNVVGTPATITLKPDPIMYSCVYSVKGYIKNTNTGKPIAAKINVKIYGLPQFQTTAGADGSFRINTNKLVVGSHKVEITAADKNIKMSKFTTWIKVNKAPVKVKAPATAKKNSKIKVKFKNAVTGKAVKKGLVFKLIFKIGKKTKKIIATTNANGNAKFKLTKEIRKGKRTFTVENNQYIVNQKFTIKIK